MFYMQCLHYQVFRDVGGVLSALGLRDGPLVVAMRCSGIGVAEARLLGSLYDCYQIHDKWASVCHVRVKRG